MSLPVTDSLNDAFGVGVLVSLALVVVAAVSDVVVADAVGTSLDSLLAVEDDWARVVDVTVVFAAVVVEFDPPEILLTWKPWMSTDDAFEKRSVACPTALSEQSSVPSQVPTLQKLGSNASEMSGVDELVDMAALYFSAVKPLVQHYTSWALNDLAAETKDPQSSELLSKMEEE
ncbi:hypothetical protein APSETT444_010420 [Aspergillus pseudonomiae]